MELQAERKRKKREGEGEECGVAADTLALLAASCCPPFKASEVQKVLHALRGALDLPSNSKAHKKCCLLFGGALDLHALQYTRVCERERA